MFNLPLASPPLSRAAAEGEKYDMPLIARRLAEVMDDVREREEDRACCGRLSADEEARLELAKPSVRFPSASLLYLLFSFVIVYVVVVVVFPQ